MVEELPDEIDIGTIELKPGIPFYYAAWGIRYRFRPTGTWRVSSLCFRKKSEANDWMREKYLRYEGMEGEVVPVKATVLLENGHIKTSVEELS